MTNYRITKYDPQNRNSEGHYQLDEWTCPSEIGKSFNGVKFEKEEYFDVESKYVEAITKILKSKHIESLRIVNLNTNFMTEHFSDPNFQWLMNKQFKEIDLFEDKSVKIAEIETLMKMNLRNFIGCSLEIDGEFRLYFGWDFYMYVNISKIKTSTINEIHKMNLYVEEYDSPSSEPYDQFSIDVVVKPNDYVDDTIYPKDISQEKIRTVLGLSIEHPCNHNFQITKENYSIFSDEIEFNFDKNEYFLNCETVYN